MTAVDGAPFTAAQFNASVRDNLNMTAAAKATQSGSIFAGTGANSLAERIPTTDYIGTTQTTTSVSYANLATVGPEVTVTSGAKALVIIAAGMFSTTVNAESFVSCDVTGATTTPADDVRALRHTSSTSSAQAMMSWAFVYPMTSGSSTYRLKYHVSSGTSSFFDRRISVVPF